MSEGHTMTVHWTGDGVLAEAMAAAANEQGHSPSLSQEGEGTTLVVEVVDNLFTVLSTREKEKNERKRT